MSVSGCQPREFERSTSRRITALGGGIALGLRQNLRHHFGMASIRKRGSSWRAEVYRDGKRESQSFLTKQQASAWATQREAELGGERLPDKTLGDALLRYAEGVSPKKKGEKWEVARLTKMGRDKVAKVKLAALRKGDISDWKERRLKEVTESSVRREMTLLLSVLEECRREWGWLHVNPGKDVKKPPEAPSRKRRISHDEVVRATLACGLTELEAETVSQRVGLAFLFALETAMRAGEIVRLTWKDVRPKSVWVEKSKNGDGRTVPLSLRAREILAALPRDRTTCFDLDAKSRDTLWRRARDDAQLGDLHFHDTRAEAIWRLSRKLPVLDLARIIGHRDLRSLMIYYEVSADDLADQL